MDKPVTEQREEITIIGGGIGGCLSALMLAKNPNYHVTLIEAQDTILNGASVIASRLHLGGEYPKNSKTAKNCLHSALVWKLLMPKTIYTPVPPIKYLIAKPTHELGLQQDEEEGLTVKEQKQSYEAVREEYAVQYKRIANALGLRKSEWLNDALFGSHKRGKFYHTLSKSELADYDQPRGSIAGGFQTQEIGLNVPKYLTMIQMELEKQQALGNITLMTGTKVTKPVTGEKGDFKIQCEDKFGQLRTLNASQVVMAAWQKGSEIVPFADLTKDTHSTGPSGVKVYKRAMLLVDLPKDFKTGPAFIMLGKHGGMLSPYNDKLAVCYLPGEETSYIKDTALDHKNQSLPADWETWPHGNQKAWAQHYFEQLKIRFPVLKGASHPRLIVRDTLNFQETLAARENQHVWEPSIVEAAAPSLRMGQEMLQEQKQVQVDERDISNPVREVKEGLYVLHPTKATYGVWSGLQVKKFVEDRTLHPRGAFATAEKDIISLLLPMEKFIYKSRPIFGERKEFVNPMDSFSLAHMEEPKEADYVRFFTAHPDLPITMLSAEPGVVERIEQAIAVAKEEQKFGKNSGKDTDSADEIKKPSWRQRIQFKSTAKDSIGIAN